MRPEKLEDFRGQTHFLHPGSLLWNSIENRTFRAAIFFGPSGTGKTTLSRIIASMMDSRFTEINASETGTKELKKILEEARFHFRGLERRPTMLYVDEFHRWNKLQQDSLLSALEEGAIRFIGSTTENPYFSINPAIISRVRNVYEFRPLSREDIESLLVRAVEDPDHGYGRRDPRLVPKPDFLLAVAEAAGGDARYALETLGFIVDNLPESESETQELTVEMAAEAVQKKPAFFNEDTQYDLLSALQKSIRGTDPDAAVHYLARLIESGADLNTIGRRLLVIASEDIGMAYPSAISITEACVSAARSVGFPEARINLAEAVILLASSPKSNSVITAIDAALEDVRGKDVGQIPDHLRDSHYSGASKLGYGNDYLYPHDFGGYVKQQYLPDPLYRAGVRYYEPGPNGSEASFRKFLARIREKYGKDTK